MSEKLHIIPHKHSITKADRLRQRGHKAPLIWFVGLSGSGKSTLASEVEKALYEKGFGTFILDGDNVRAGLNKDLDFSDASRKENIRRIGEVAKLMTDAGVITISAFISPFEAERKTIKELIGSENFIEVYVNCPLSVCEERDVKGLYKKARAGEISNFTGISSPFEAPSHPAIEIPSAELSIEEGVRQIMEVLESRLSL